jgi:hypothetical protein
MKLIVRYNKKTFGSYCNRIDLQNEISGRLIGFNVGTCDIDLFDYRKTRHTVFQPIY